MRNTQSIVDQVNANRKRRTPPSLDDLNRTLQGLEKQLRGLSEPLSDEEAGKPLSTESAPEPRQEQRPKEPSLLHDRPVDEDAGGLSAIATELQELRDELRHEMSMGVRRELENLGKDMVRLRGMIAEDGYSSHIAKELGRVSAGVQALANRTRSEDLVVLREDLEELKQTVQTLAREESVSRLGNRWDMLDRRFDALESRYSDVPGEGADPTDAIGARLDRMREAIGTLPDSGAIHSLEDKVKLLAGAIEHLSRQHAQATSPGAIAQIEERLDEISRAIAASGRTAPGQGIDNAVIERIEARIASLVTRIEELPHDFPSDKVLERISELGRRMETLAARHENTDHRIADLTEQMENIARQLGTTPSVAETLAERMADLGERIDQIASRRQEADQQVGELTQQVTAIAKHLEAASPAIGVEDFKHLEQRITAATHKLEEAGKRGKATDTAILDAVDRRFDELIKRLDSHIAAAPASDQSFVAGLESRLDELSRRLAESPVRTDAIDHETIRGLEAQIANLADHLSSLPSAAPEFGSIAPRLEAIEQSIADSQGAILETARRAAEEAVRRAASHGAEVDGGVIADLAGDLKSLESLARQSDKRNTKTFEAIHETLLKIVERLGALETEMAEAQPAKTMLVDAPSLQYDDETREMEREPEVATADVEASDTVSDTELRETEAPAGKAAAPAVERKKSSLLKGLSRAVKKRGSAKAETAQAATAKVSEPAFEAPLAGDAETDEIDQAAANRPLEPGSGAPDLNSIMRRVREERRDKTDTGREDASKADFIAAARRAAQAAVAESDSLRREPGAGAGKSRLVSGDLIRRQRKPILMAVAAVVVAMAALQVKNAFFMQRPATVAVKTVKSKEPVQVTKKAEQTKPVASAAEQKPAAPVQAAGNALASSAPASDKAAPSSAPAPAPAVTAGAAAPSRPQNEAVATTQQPASTTTAADATPAPDTTAEARSETKPAPSPAVQSTDNQPPAATGAPRQAASVTVPDDIGPVVLRQAAEEADPKALYEIGNRYADGTGVTSDLAEAAKWYQKSADLGFAPAEYRIGNFYEKGIGVGRDIDKAKIWYEKAADQGNATAMHNLAVLLAMGVDGTPDNAAAARWFAKAAEVGVKDSQYNLGIMSAKGLGVQQNLEESYKWFALAAKSGDEEAAKKRDQVAKALKPDQLAQARGAVELWKPKPLVASANSVDVPDAWRDTAVSKTASIDMKKAVVNIQRILAGKGFDPGPADGVMGQKTRDAIAAFQKANGMTPTGEVDQALVKALLEKNQ